MRFYEWLIEEKNNIWFWSLLHKLSNFHAVPNKVIWIKMILLHFMLCWFILIFHDGYVVLPQSWDSLTFPLKCLRFRAYSQGENRRTTLIWRVKKIKTQMKDINFFWYRLQIWIVFHRTRGGVAGWFFPVAVTGHISNLRVTAKFPV